MNTTILEREVKLRFSSADEARDAVIATGATPLHGRRLQEDALLDTRRRTNCAAADACSASGWRTARAGSPIKGRCSPRR